mgnify:CR=1 FL=1
MINIIIIIIFFILNGCSTFKKEIVECPKLIAPKEAAEIVVNSENNLPIYVGFRGVNAVCLRDSNNIKMEISANIRAIRKDTKDDDYVPVNIAVVSVDSNYKEYDRDDFSYSQFLLKNSKIIDRTTKFKLIVPKGGKVLLGIK